MNEINLFNNHVLIVAPVTFAPAGAMTPSVEFLYNFEHNHAGNDIDTQLLLICQDETEICNANFPHFHRAE